MKVRHKLVVGGVPDTGAYLVIDEGKDWYVGTQGSGPPVLLHKQAYDVIPEKTWRDVTAECRLVDGWRLRHGAVLITAMLPSLGYRLVKVCDCDPMPPVAFIVEQQEEA